MADKDSQREQRPTVNISKVPIMSSVRIQAHKVRASRGEKSAYFMSYVIMVMQFALNAAESLSARAHNVSKLVRGGGEVTVQRPTEFMQKLA